MYVNIWVMKTLLNTCICQAPPRLHLSALSPRLHLSALLGNQPSRATNSAAAASGGWTIPPHHNIKNLILEDFFFERDKILLNYYYITLRLSFIDIIPKCKH